MGWVNKVLSKLFYDKNKQQDESFKRAEEALLEVVEFLNILDLSKVDDTNRKACGDAIYNLIQDHIPAINEYLSTGSDYFEGIDINLLLDIGEMFNVNVFESETILNSLLEIREELRLEIEEGV